MPFEDIHNKLGDKFLQNSATKSLMQEIERCPNDRRVRELTDAQCIVTALNDMCVRKKQGHFYWRERKPADKEFLILWVPTRWSKEELDEYKHGDAMERVADSKERLLLPRGDRIFIITTKIVGPTEEVDSVSWPADSLANIVLFYHHGDAYIGWQEKLRRRATLNDGKYTVTWQELQRYRVGNHEGVMRKLAGMWNKWAEDHGQEKFPVSSARSSARIPRDNTLPWICVSVVFVVALGCVFTSRRTSRKT